MAEYRFGASPKREICVRNYFTQNFSGRSISGFPASLLLAVILAIVAGCGGGGGLGRTPAASETTGTTTGLGGTNTSGTVQTITGTAATGDPLAGATVTVQDSVGKSATGTTAADGTFSISVTNGKPPFMLVAVPTAGANLYSVLPSMDMTVTNSQNVNITTITTLVMFELNGGQDPVSMYKNLLYSTLTASAVAVKEITVRAKLPANSMNAIFSTMYGKFVAAAGGSDPYDDALDSLGKITSISSPSVTLVNTATPPVTTTYNSATSTSGTGTTTVASPSVTVSLTDPTTGAAVTSISSTSNALVKAAVLNASGAAVSNAVVTFTTDPVFGAFSGGANTALTNSSGVASVTLTTPNTSGGAATVTASTTVAGTAVGGSVNYAVGTSTLSLSAISLPAGTLSAYGTASVSVNVLNNGVLYTTPMTVNFTSACAASGKATLTAAVTTVNGKASASYLDNGCNNASPGDTITATLSNGGTATANLPVGAPTLGSIQYVSTITSPATTPPMITLKGTGGVSRSETARVTFKVVDNAGNPVGNTLVNFSLNTCLGGLTLSGATATCSPNATLSSATSDPTTGYVVTNVIAGTISTAVRVTATTATTPALSTQSDQLVVSTGIPAQDAFSLSATAHNIEAWSIDGMTSTLTARLADHFHNPVPDGTAVAFTTEGGSVASSCNTVGGACSVVWTSQALRPSNGRSTVLARATGEEAFVDRNFNGTVDDKNEMIDANFKIGVDTAPTTDMAEAFVDYNENGTREDNEPYFDFNGDKQFSPADTLYNGVLCTAGSAICSTQKSIDVRGSQVIVFSSSSANITINGGATIALTPCSLVNGNVPSTFTVTVVDVNGNAMPAGTTVAFSSDNGTITSATSVVIPDTTACRTTGYPGCPTSAGSATFGDIAINMKSNATYTPADPTTVPPTAATCKDTGNSGSFTATVTSPRGVVTTRSATATD
jgi:hypothetical protein